MIGRAIELATIAHAGAVDRAGVDYINHPARVAALVEAAGGDDVAIAAAWLHDVVEDTHYTRADIEAACGVEVADVVALLSKNLAADYDSYYEGIRANARARMVKVADLTHNSDVTRLSVVTDADIERTARYAGYLAFLG